MTDAAVQLKYRVGMRLIAQRYWPAQAATNSDGHKTGTYVGCA
jgi:hypothetical protein